MLAADKGGPQITPITQIGFPSAAAQIASVRGRREAPQTEERDLTK
jgi:hypothetical protein